MKPLHTTQAEGQWHWHATAKHLFIEVPRDSAFTVLQGDWALPDLDLILDGLSRGRLKEAFKSAEGSVAVNIRLSDGRDVHFAGGFASPVEARGFVLTDPDASQLDPSELEPGPDLMPVFQPILSLRDGTVAGFEALARWDTGASTRTPPSAYDDEALAPNMLIRAAETLSELRAISGQANLFMHVNLTARDLGKPNLPALIEALMQGYDLPPKSMKVELTEQAALRNASNALAAAYALKQAGVGLVLDDFGTGHSSFEWLADLPADSLKIDPGLIARVGQPRTNTILSTITLLASRLGMTATAEGVEVREQAAQLRQLGFDHVQGFAFARPMDAAAARSWIRNFK